MQDNFEKALEFTLPHEGVHSYDQQGGDTRYGLARNFHEDIPQAEWDNLTLDQAKAIYRSQYWNELHCDDLPFPLDVIVFDSAVNPGTGAAARFLAVTADHETYIYLRIQHYLKHSEPQYKAGLIQRCVDLRSKFIAEVKVL